ncbi:glutathionylspermidine synthase family protein [Gallaecimonas kandeliae]|uniref:glutathionylspermidine synthase family protein n=1 Tax=Gallaecimonas kandeliae TaxID=3029055 RepID=UPI002647FC0A|nr:glutathionylspermidine synthase family protein [Gallaecimonas kandeliae]WKE66291.1 glutathionylspermidine synthase family protein [Gallaecimonas kandeliae]
MERVRIEERPWWREQAEELGFQFHTIEGEKYWDESAYYSFSLEEVETRIEDPTAELHAMALDLVDQVVASEEKLALLDIPEAYWDLVSQSWKNREPHLYGRLDFSYGGAGPAKLLELNYDTPTSLYESGFFQWLWLEDALRHDMVPAGADQYNGIQEQLESRFRALNLGSRLHFASVWHSDEDLGTVRYLQDIAAQAGLETAYVPMEQIGFLDGQFLDRDDTPIEALFKLYPWEFMLEEEFARFIPGSPTRWLEPPWKLVLANKGILPLLWQAHPGHPNLLEACFDDGSSLKPGWARKPLFSREGANVELVLPNGSALVEPGPYGGGRFVRQALAPLPVFDGNHVLVGSWVVGDQACGMGIREDSGPITKDSARFLPHILLD